MSLILDALRRADAERAREQGAVPGLHTQPLPTGGNASPNRLWWAAGGVGVVLAAAALWWLHGPAPAAAPAAPPPAVAAAPAPLPAPAAAPTPLPAPQPEPAAVLAAPPALPAVVSPEPVASAPVQQPSTTPVATPAVADVDLPVLPNTRVGGVMYSDSRESRLLIVNDLVLHEGDSVAPGLVLERIGPHLATLKRGGERYKLTY